MVDDWLVVQEEAVKIVMRLHTAQVQPAPQVVVGDDELALRDESCAQRPY